jgi:hypothetical protein
MRFVAVFLGLLAIAGCSSEPRMPKGYYDPPIKPAQPALAKVVPLPPDAVASQVLAGINGTALTTGHVDIARGIVVATYSGDPEGFVDCGTVRFGRTGRTVPASDDSFIVNNITRNELPGDQVRRDLRLDTRMVIAAEPFGTSTSVTVDAMHILSKSVQVGDEMVKTESIAFDNESDGKFDIGTRCHSTGKLEEMALEGIPGPLVLLGQPSTPQVASVQSSRIRRSEVPPPTLAQASQAAPQGQPLQLAAVPPPVAPPALESPASPGLVVPPPVAPPALESPASPALAVAMPSVPQAAQLDCARPTGGSADQMCEVLALLAPYRSGGLGARLLQGDLPLSEGDDVVLEIDLPRQPANLQLSYIDSTGIVTHLPSLPSRGDVQRSIYATGLSVTRPFGQEMVLVMASSEPAIAGERPPREPITSYLGALREGLSRAAAPVDADVVMVTTMGQ